MQIFNILDRYIGKIVLTNVMITTCSLVSLSSIIKFIEQLKIIGQGNYNIINAGIYILLSIPKDIQIFLPITILIGTLIGVGIVSHHNELTAMQSIGFTFIRIKFAIIKFIIIIILLTMIISEFIVPKLEQIACNYRAQSIYGGSLLSIKNGIWIKDGYNFVYIEHVKKNNELYGLHIYMLNKENNLDCIRYAKFATFNKNKKLWILSQSTESNLQNHWKINNIKNIYRTWKSTLTPDKLDIVVSDPNTLSINGLYKYIKYLKSSGQDTKIYQLDMWNKILQPFFILTMISTSLSLVFIFIQRSNISTNTCITISIFFGFLFYIVNHIFGSLTLIYNIKPIIGSGLPSVIFLSILIFFRLLFNFQKNRLLIKYNFVF